MSAVPGATAGSTAAAAHHQLVQAVRASGVIVELEPQEFQTILNYSKDPLIVTASAGFTGRKTRYLMSYRGLAFCTTSSTPLNLPGSAQTISAKKIWIPN